MLCSRRECSKLPAADYVLITPFKLPLAQCGPTDLLEKGSEDRDALNKTFTSYLSDMLC